MLEDLEITVADQIQKNKKSNFQAVWDAADSEGKFGDNNKEIFNSFFLIFL